MSSYKFLVFYRSGITRASGRWLTGLMALTLATGALTAEAAPYATHYIFVLDDRPDSLAVKKPGLVESDLRGQVRILPWDSEGENLLTIVNVGFGGRTKGPAGCIDPPGPTALWQGVAQPFQGQQGLELLLAKLGRRECWGRARQFSPAVAPFVAMAAVGEALASGQPRLAFARTVIIVATDEPALRGEATVDAVLRERPGLPGNDRQSQATVEAARRSFTFGWPTRRTFNPASLEATVVPVRNGEGREQRYWEWRPEPRLSPPPVLRAAVDSNRLVLDLAQVAPTFRPIWLTMSEAVGKPLDLIACSEGEACQLAAPRLLIDPAALGPLPESGNASLLWRYVPEAGGITYRGTFVQTPVSIALASPAQVATAAAPPAPAPGSGAAPSDPPPPALGPGVWVSLTSSFSLRWLLPLAAMLQPS